MNIPITLKLQLQNLGLAWIRIGIGILFMIHGYQKFIGGKETLTWAGSQMSHIGITWFPLFWGIIAANAEFFGGLLLILGLGTRFISAILTFAMIIALLYHLNAGDAFKVYSHALAMIIVLIGFVIGGAGTYSLDRWIYTVFPQEKQYK